MVSSLQDVCRASIPEAALSVLADVRCLAGVRVTGADGRAWLEWSEEQQGILKRLLPVAGLELYEKRAGLWFRHGGFLPAKNLPPPGGQSLASLLVPVPVTAEPPSQRDPVPCPVRLVRDANPRETTAMLCELKVLNTWAESASSLQIAGMEAALSGDRVLLRGSTPPLLPGCQRLWGRRLVTPLGFRIWPGLAENVLLEALGVAVEETLLLGEEGGEVIPQSAFQRLSRAAIRLACEEQR